MLRLRIRFPKNSNMFDSCAATFVLFGTLLINARGHILQNSEKNQGQLFRLKTLNAHLSDCSQ